MPKVLINITLFQLGWFACVIGGAYGYPLTGSLIAVMAILYHLYVTKQRKNELMFVISAMLIGLFFDSFLVYNGWLAYSNGILHPNLAPYWIMVMWGLFATTINISMKWLNRSLILPFIFGLIGGPLAYLAGSNIGAVQFIDKTNALIALAIGWSIITPSLPYLSKTITQLHVRIHRNVQCKN